MRKVLQTKAACGDQVSRCCILKGRQCKGTRPWCLLTLDCKKALWLSHQDEQTQQKLSQVTATQTRCSRETKPLAEPGQDICGQGYSGSFCAEAPFLNLFLSWLTLVFKLQFRPCFPWVRSSASLVHYACCHGALLGHGVRCLPICLCTGLPAFVQQGRLTSFILCSKVPML